MDAIPDRMCSAALQPTSVTWHKTPARHPQTQQRLCLLLGRTWQGPGRSLPDSECCREGSSTPPALRGDSPCPPPLGRAVRGTHPRQMCGPGPRSPAAVDQAAWEMRAKDQGVGCVVLYTFREAPGDRVPMDTHGGPEVSAVGPEQAVGAQESEEARILLPELTAPQSGTCAGSTRTPRGPRPGYSVGGAWAAARALAGLLWVQPSLLGALGSRKAGGTGPGSGQSSPRSLRCPPTTGLCAHVRVCGDLGRGHGGCPEGRKRVWSNTPPREGPEHSWGPSSHHAGPPPLGSPGFACPVRMVGRGEAILHRPPGVRGAKVTHGAVDPQGEQHDEENDGPGRGQRERGQRLWVDDEDQPGPCRRVVLLPLPTASTPRTPRGEMTIPCRRLPSWRSPLSGERRGHRARDSRMES